MCRCWITKKLTLDNQPFQENKEDQDKNEREEVMQPIPKHPDLPKEWRYAYGHHKELILSDLSKGVITRSSIRNECDYIAFVSQIEPKCIEEAEKDPN